MHISTTYSTTSKLHLERFLAVVRFATRGAALLLLSLELLLCCFRLLYLPSAPLHRSSRFLDGSTSKEGMDGGLLGFGYWARHHCIKLLLRVVPTNLKCTTSERNIWHDTKATCAESKDLYVRIISRRALQMAQFELLGAQHAAARENLGGQNVPPHLASPICASPICELASGYV